MSEAHLSANLIVWTDIPVLDLDRATAFYAAVLDRAVERQDFGAGPFGVIAHRDGNGGCLVLGDGTPSPAGPLVYFNVDGRIQAALSQAQALGGQLLQPLHAIGPHGFRAVLLDSEGNRLALHSGSDR